MWITYVLIAIAILALLYVAGGYQEGFLVMGEYPHVEETNLLNCSYPSTGRSSLSTQGSAELSKEQSRTPMSSFEQITNNKKYWNTPDNGTCSPADFCGVLYGSRSWSTPHFSPPSIGDFDGRRIGMFSSPNSL